MHSPEAGFESRLNASGGSPSRLSATPGVGAPHIRAFRECVGACAIRRALTLAVVSVLLLLLASRPAQAQTLAVLHNFAGGSDGSDPESSLTPDGKGNFYGTTYAGGLGFGTVFELSPNRNGGWNETVLHSFTSADGANPVDAYVIFDSAGNLYGTTYYGGTSQSGVVFELSPKGTGWAETVLHNFGVNAGDGLYPVNGLIMDAAGNLYGTTEIGYGSGGTVFELSPSESGWTEQVIYNGGVNAPDYFAGLAMDAAGNIFGVNEQTVFELSPNGSGGWIPTVIHTFPRQDGVGEGQDGTPVLDQAGNLYGTTYYGGVSQQGTVYKLSPGKNGKWSYKILHAFKGPLYGDGSYPCAGIVFDKAGDLYGTTSNGGKSRYGTVFELIAPVHPGAAYKEKVLWSFNNTDGLEPNAGLILDSAGNLYGTTSAGGSSGYGVVFEVTP